MGTFKNVVPFYQFLKQRGKEKSTGCNLDEMAVAVMRDYLLILSNIKTEKFKAQINKKACYKKFIKYEDYFSIINERIAARSLRSLR